MRPESENIPESLYKKIIRVMPIPCVDAVIIKGDNFLLGKRTNKPARGQWFVIGGRIFIDEKLEEAIFRHIKKETGVKKIKIRKVLGTKEVVFKNSAQGPSSHAISTVFLVELSKDVAIPANAENSKLGWFSRIDRRWHPYVREMLRRAGFK